MHIIGIWSQQRDSDDHRSSSRLGNLDLRLDDHVTTLKNESTKLAYEGIIFDRTPDELTDSQTALDDAYGSYSYVKIDKNENEIIIGTDKLGFNPMYYSLQREALVFGTSLTLVKYKIKNASPDYEAWDEILNLGDILGEKTTVKEIKRLNPGTRIHIKDGEVTFKTFWSLEAPVKGDKEGYVWRNNELLAEALELTRNVPGPKIVLLSGGEDSRRIGVSAQAIDFPVTFATQDTIHIGDLDEDVIIAQIVSKCLNRPLIRQRLPLKEDSYNDKLIRDYWLGFETVQHEWIMPLIRNLSERSLIYDGIAGDVTINGGCIRLYSSWLDWYRDKDIDRVVKAICGERSEFQDNPIQMDKTKIGSSLHERVREQLLSFPDCPHRLDFFVLMNHTRRNTALQAQLYSLLGYKMCFPFLYYPLFIQSLSIDPKFQLDMPGHKSCMRLLNPEVAKIPSTTRGNLSKEYKIDRSRESKERELLFIKRVTLRPEIKKLFPTIRSRLRIFELASLFGIKRISSRLNWRAFPLSRMSNYLDWLDDSTQPDFPVRADEPAFLKERFIE